MPLLEYAETGSVVLLLAAGLFCGWSVLQLHLVRTGPGVIPPPPGPVPPSLPSPEPATEVALLERLLVDEPAATATDFGVGDLVSGAAATGRSMGLRVSVISGDEGARAVPADVATALDTMLTDVARHAPTGEVVLRSRRTGDYVELSVGPSTPSAARRGLGLHLSRTALRGQGGDLVVRRGTQGASLVARIPAATVRVPAQRRG